MAPRLIRTVPCKKCGSYDRLEKNHACYPCARERGRLAAAAKRARDPAAATREVVEWRRRNPDRWRAHYRKKQLKAFGITAADYDAMHARQNGLCAICDRPETAPDITGRKPRSLAVDHDHATGKVRALLCMRCNNGIGLLDAPERLRRAAAYLEEHNG